MLSSVLEYSLWTVHYSLASVSLVRLGTRSFVPIGSTHCVIILYPCVEQNSLVSVNLRAVHDDVGTQLKEKQAEMQRNGCSTNKHPIACMYDGLVSPSDAH